MEYDYWVDSSDGFCEKRLTEEKWVKGAYCDESKNTRCGPSTCIKGVNASCPPNFLEVSDLQAGKSIADSLADLGKTGVSHESVVVIKKADATAKTPAKIAKVYYDKSKSSAKYGSFVALEISQSANVCLNPWSSKTTNEIYVFDNQ